MMDYGCIKLLLREDMDKIEYITNETGGIDPMLSGTRSWY